MTRRRRPESGWVLPVAVAVVLAAGVAVTGWLGSPARAVTGYAGGLLVAAAVLLVASVLVARAAARSPVMGLVAALGCYAATILGFAVLLVVVEPGGVEVRAWAAGLAVGGVLATLIALRRATASRHRY